MQQSRMHQCAICGEEQAAGQIWFLVAESHWEDKLRILRWQDDVACRRGMYRVCSPSHVQELVVHWMTMGSLDFPFALPGELRESRLGTSLPVIAEPDIQNAQLIGELSVHRESVRRALQASPDSLQIVLDELFDALEREASGASARFDSGRMSPAGWLRQM